jgi:hypothetical protein
MKSTVAIVAACLFAGVLASRATSDAQIGAVAEAGKGASSGPLQSEEVRRIAGLLERQLYRCWKPPMVTDVIVTIQFTLNRDGSLAGEPTLVTTSTGTQSQAVAESALRAVDRFDTDTRNV